MSAAFLSGESDTIFILIKVRVLQDFWPEQFVINQGFQAVQSGDHGDEAVDRSVVSWNHEVVLEDEVKDGLAAWRLVVDIPEYDRVDQVKGQE